MLPLLRPTLGRKGPRPVVGHLAGHDAGSIVGARHRVTGRVATRLVERPGVAAKLRKAKARPRCVQAGLARHVRDLARASPATA